MIKNYEYITTYKNYKIYKGLRYYCIGNDKNNIMYDYFIDLNDVKKFIDEML